VLGAGGPVAAQVERRQLPVLPGEAPPTDQDYGAPSAPPPAQGYGAPTPLSPPAQDYGVRPAPPPVPGYGAPPAPPPAQDYGGQPAPPPAQDYGAPTPLAPPRQDYGYQPAPLPDQDYGAQPTPPPAQDYGAPTPLAPPRRDYGNGAPTDQSWSPADRALPPAFRQSAGSASESALPPDLWQGLDSDAIRRLIGLVAMPSPSPALANLIARALATSAGADMTASIAALERAGRVDELIDLLGQTNEPRALGSYAVALLAAGRAEDACALQLDALGQPGGPAQQALLIPAYCAALSGDKEAARRALAEARGKGADIAFAGRALDGRAPPPPRADVLDYLFFKLGQGSARADLAAKATPELLFLLARDDEAQTELRLAAAERAASLNVIDGAVLATVYREAAPKLPKAAQSPSALRAKLFAALQSQASEQLRAESIDALLASAKDAKIERAMAQAIATAGGGLAQTPQANFAETGVRVAALAGDEQTAWDLTEAGSDRVRSWQLLLATTDPLSDRARTALESGVDIALKAGLPGPLLQRLVTALDALGEEVPIPLWELAAKTPQPDGGYLPPTGLLSALKEAADKGETGAAILLAAAAFGPDGPQGANLIALGDGIRALKRVGLDSQARQIAFEALYAHWPARGKS
jgi:hypothetical protein